MKLRWPRGFRAFDRWLLMTQPDWWLSRLHVLAVLFPLLLLVVLATAFMWPMRLNLLPGADLGELAVTLPLVLVAAWGLVVGRLQIEHPVRGGSKGALDIMRFALAFMLLASLGFVFRATLRGREGALVDQSQFERDNALLRSVPVRADNRVVGLSFENADTPPSLGELTRAELRDWLAVVGKYATTAEDSIIRQSLVSGLIRRRVMFVDSIVRARDRVIETVLDPTVWFPVPDSIPVADLPLGFDLVGLDVAALAARGLSVEAVQDSVEAWESADLKAVAKADTAFLEWVAPLIEITGVEGLLGALSLPEPRQRGDMFGGYAYRDQVRRQDDAIYARQNAWMSDRGGGVGINDRMLRLAQSIAGERSRSALFKDLAVLIFGSWYAGLIVFLVVRSARLIRPRTLAVLGMVAPVLWIIGTAYELYRSFPIAYFSSLGVLAPWWLRVDPVSFGLYGTVTVAAILVPIALRKADADQLILGSLLAMAACMPLALAQFLDQTGLLAWREMTMTGAVARSVVAALFMLALGHATQGLLNRERARPA